MAEAPKCLYCGKPFERRHPAQKFCGKRKTGRHLCKDRYHNREQFRAMATTECLGAPDLNDGYYDPYKN